MKKITLWVSVLVLSVITFSSCCTTKVTSTTKVKTPTTSEVLADLNISSDKITYTYQTTIKHQPFLNIDDLKDNAVYEALKKVGADVLVAPQFMITKNECSGATNYEIVVTGYPATYTNFRQKAAAEKIELRELKEGASYVIIRKSSNNTEVEVDKEIIVAPSKHRAKVVDLDETTVDQVILNGREGRRPGK